MHGQGSYYVLFLPLYVFSIYLAIYTVSPCSVMNLWNLSMHLYLEKFEECETINLTGQLADLQPKVHTQNSQLQASQQLCGSLRDQLIPDLKESVRELKIKYHSKENDHTLTKSKVNGFCMWIVVV